MKTRVPQIAEAIAHEVGTAIGFATKVQAEFPISMIGAQRQVPARLQVRRRARQLARRQGTDRRRRLHHAVELPAASDRREGGAGARGGLHVVLKPAELAPLSALMLADAAHEIGSAARRLQRRLRIGPRRGRSDRRRTPTSTW